MPILRLLPKAEARAVRHGFPWVFANEVVLDRRTRAIAPGSFVRLEENDGRALGLVTVNPASKIIGRMMDRNPEAQIDQPWIAAKIAHALTLRAALYDTPHYRLVHAEADGLPGVVIDRFGDVAVIQPNAAWAEVQFDLIADALAEVTGVRSIIRNGSGRARALEGLPEVTEIARGAVDGPVPVPMNGATYMADVLGGQKTGLFFDQRPNHAFAATLAKGGSVLDVFAHVGGFSLAALAAGATDALAVDSSAPALALAEAGAKASGMADRFNTLQADAFDALQKLADEGRRFDAVICDPPAFAPNKPALDAGLRAYERVARGAAALVAPGGYLGLCSCSHAADLASFRNASARGIGRAGRRGVMLHTGFAGPDHPQLPQLAESGYLKAVFFRLD
ncbi:MAG: 23S rRNA (cytosine1962-C5)-methyltransferase RlmI [Roseibaca calidilacus]|uniref:23S rRNA (Cytosine1962-C5)-methyltransferase RlmI n=2 Tax=Roseibaca calidilacus TaxID=1666912 RepID=A0A0N8K8Y3_9RHOB|nr:MAG: 23S rRNA (cytosine1962-C5)-methyltransferase RlmI [Roseibaca calidilacus]CUX81659.1 SAM-dependent methyltransferase [Roseibaca calidilacus]